MRRFQPGTIYLFPITSSIYGVCPSRVWWAPWRWSLDVYYWTAHDTIADPLRVADNISKANVIGLIKLLGYPHEISN